MTTTRINHTGHNHPNTTAARTACRKALKNNPPAIIGGNLDLATVGNGTRVHYIDYATNTTRCGKVQPVYVRAGNIDDVDCKGCRNKFGHAHS